MSGRQHRSLVEALRDQDHLPHRSELDAAASRLEELDEVVAELRRKVVYLEALERQVEEAAS